MMKHGNANPKYGYGMIWVKDLVLHKIADDLSPASDVLVFQYQHLSMLDCRVCGYHFGVSHTWITGFEEPEIILNIGVRSVLSQSRSWLPGPQIALRIYTYPCWSL
jgi:hypothetical protein